MYSSKVYKAWYKKNSKDVIVKVRKYQETHVEELRQYRKEYYDKNKELLYEKDTTANERQKKYYVRNRSKVLKRRYKARSIGSGLIHRRAQTKITNALASGKLKRKPCEVCGNPVSEGHHDDYDKPLEVRWLCSKHHGLCHRSLSPSSSLGGT